MGFVYLLGDYGKEKTYGEVTLMGELMGLLNSKTQMENDKL